MHMVVRRWLPPLGAALLALGVLVAVVVLTQRAGDNDHDNDDPAAPSQSLRPIAFSGYEQDDATHLTLVYATGLPECDGRIVPPRVEETAGAVRVELLLEPVDVPPDTPCPEIAKVMHVTIELERPLGDRVVRDVSQDGAVVPPGDPMQP